MSNPVIIAVPSDQLDKFKSISNAFFKILAKYSNSSKVPIRKGYDILAKAMGYSSHPHLVTNAKGIQNKYCFIKLMHQHSYLVAERLNDLMNSLSIEKLEKALIQASPLTSKASTDFIDKLNASQHVKVDYKKRSPLHKLLLENRLEELTARVRAQSWTSELLQKENWILEFLVEHEKIDELAILSDLDLLSQEDKDYLFSQSIHWNNTNSAKYLLSIGANVNAGSYIKSEQTIFNDLIDAGQHELINLTIDKHLVEPNPKYLTSSTNGVSANSILVFMATDRISDNHSREKSLELAVHNGQVYKVAYLLHEHPHLKLNIPHTARSFDSDIVNLSSLIRLSAIYHSQTTIIDSLWVLEALLSALFSIDKDELLNEDSEYILDFILQADDSCLSKNRILTTLESLITSELETLFRLLMQKKANATLKEIYSERFVKSMSFSFLSLALQHLPLESFTFPGINKAKIFEIFLTSLFNQIEILKKNNVKIYAFEFEKFVEALDLCCKTNLLKPSKMDNLLDLVKEVVEPVTNIMEQLDALPEHS